MNSHIQEHPAMFKFGMVETRACPRCNYKIAAPYPVNCPRCNEPLEKVVSSVVSPANAQIVKENEVPSRATTPPPTDFAATITSHAKASQPLVQAADSSTRPAVPKTPPTLLSKEGDYLKMMGVINLQSREVIFCSNDEYAYVLDLGANAHEIATSILGGDLERILLEPPKEQAIAPGDGEPPAKNTLFTFEEAIFQTHGSMLFCIYGVFFKRPAVLLQELKRLMIDIFKGQVKAAMSPLERSEIERRKASISGFIVHEYQKIRDAALRRATIPTMENVVKLHYVGLSFQSIGTMALLLTPRGPDALPIKDMSFSGDTADGNYLDLLESLISAKIEAIAANTLAHTGSFPRYIITKVGFDQYRLIEFFQLANSYNLQILASGNISLLESVLSEVILPIVAPITAVPFSGMLTTHNEIKAKLRERLSNNYIYEIKK
ncbi:MAG: hypothetical protein Q6370_024205 [Candidatus Sigynarchaeota archaeon]